MSKNRIGKQLQLRKHKEALRKISDQSAADIANLRERVEQRLDIAKQDRKNKADDAAQDRNDKAAGMSKQLGEASAKQVEGQRNIQGQLKKLLQSKESYSQQRVNSEKKKNLKKERERHQKYKKEKRDLQQQNHDLLRSSKKDSKRVAEGKKTITKLEQRVRDLEGEDDAKFGQTAIQLNFASSQPVDNQAPKPPVVNKERHNKAISNHIARRERVRRRVAAADRAAEELGQQLKVTKTRRSNRAGTRKKKVVDENALNEKTGKK